MNTANQIGKMFLHPRVWIVLLTLLLLCLGPVVWKVFIDDGGLQPRGEDAPVPQSTGSPDQTLTSGNPDVVIPAQPSAAGKAWFSETVDPNPEVGIFTSLVAGPDGSLHVAYLDDSNDDLKIASFDGAAWSLQSGIGDSSGRDGWYASLVVDPQGALHLSYFSYSQQQIIYGVRLDSGEWTHEVVVSGVSALDTSLAVTAGNIPHIVYFDEAAGQVRYAVRQAEGWTTSTIGDGDPAGITFPLAAGADGALHAAFRSSTGVLLYASLAGGAWKTEPVESGGGAGYYPALALDLSGWPHLSYYDPSRGLVYAYRDESGWHPTIVDGASVGGGSGGEVSLGKFTSLAVDSLGIVNISYYDEGSASLKHAAGHNSQWSTHTVSSEGEVGKYNAITLVQDMPVISYYDEGEQHLMVAYTGGAQNRLTAHHRSGQTFLTWLERSDLHGERYSIYRSSAPIDPNNLSQAALLAQVGESSSIFWANYRVGDEVWKPRLSKYLVTADGAPPAGKGRGVFVWTVSPEDYQGEASGEAYYAVTIVENSTGQELYADAYRAGPIQEAVGDPAPVEITASPGILYQPGSGGHYFIQYMDFRRWNPTFHAPNSTNSYYGLSLDDPQRRSALAYAYDYTVYEPTAELCGGAIPETLPVMIFLHGARGNRYPAIEQYPYPYCAYGIYPVEQSETWYFGFARQHDYRSDAPFSPDDVIENYTERRVLRMLYDLIQNPLGPPVDTQRVYLFGHSMGGTGSLAFAQRYPNVFAGIYSGQPVTWFYATQGYEETWPTNLATKWGPQDLNLPVSISAPGGWSDPLQKYNGAGVFVWENLRLAFDPNDPLKRIHDDMVPFGVDHGTIDDSVLFATQGRPLYPILNASARAWAGAITEATHEWSQFGWPLPNLARNNEVPFWNFGVIRDETVPGFSSLSGNLTQPPDAPTQYNQTILWSASWNAWDGSPVDQPDEWQMSFCAVQAGSQSCGSGQPLLVDITPRRAQRFAVTPSKTYQWENHSIQDNQLLQSGTVKADSNGLLTILQVQVLPDGSRLRIFSP